MVAAKVAVAAAASALAEAFLLVPQVHLTVLRAADSSVCVFVLAFQRSLDKWRRCLERPILPGGAVKSSPVSRKNRMRNPATHCSCFR